MLVRTLALSGYGLWVWIGLALAAGVYPSGRGDTLVPLAWGGVLVSVPPLLACLSPRRSPDWLGWHFGRASRPTAEGLMALVTYLPMLAVAGLARGDNLFWATRLSGAMLAGASLITLIYAMRPLSSASADWKTLVAHSAGRGMSAMYTGGLWLWLCAVAQLDGGPREWGFWLLLLPVVTVASGVLDARRWQAVPHHPWQTTSVKKHPSSALMPALSATLVYLIPALSLLLTPQAQHVWLAALAAIGCVLGKTLEQHLYHRAQASADSHLSPA